MKTSLQKQEKGFTIIEVLIVLAIAGLILLIVFLAVPALQRNSRNTQRKNDISGILGAVGEYSSNKNGQMPTQKSDWSGQVKLGYYTDSNITQGTATTAITDADAVRVVVNAKCNADGSATNTSANRRYVAQFAVETGGAATSMCQEG